MPAEAKFIVKKNRQCHLLFIVLLIATGALICYCACLGDANIPVKDILRIIGGKAFNRPEWYGNLSDGIVAIVWDIRLPRILCGAFVGAGLSIAGAVFQSLLMNPLADPYTLGVSTGAALGASIAILISGIMAIVYIPVLPAAFVGAILTLMLVTSIANRSNGLTSSNLIIAGVIVSSIMSAGISMVKYVAGEEVGAIVFWIMGSLASRTWQHVLIAVPFIIICFFVCYHYSHELNILCNGDETANVLGINIKKVRLILLVSASLITATCVAVSGVIGFVGLVIPHLLRFGITSNNRNLLPLSAVTGAMMLVIADNFSRVVFSGEIPVGVLTTLVGGPFFIYIFMKKAKRGGNYS